MIGRARTARVRGRSGRSRPPRASALPAASPSAASRPATVLLSALLALAGIIAGTAPATAQAARPSPSLRVGTQTLTLCASVPTAYCGTLSVPLDYSTPAGPHISIAYRFYPASAPPGGQAAGTVVPAEGGPGYPSTGSVAYQSDGAQAGYSAMYGPLLQRWNMLAVDNRGTGQSTPLSCPALQDFSGESGTEAFQLTSATCAAALNHRGATRTAAGCTRRTCSRRRRRRRIWRRDHGAGSGEGGPVRRLVRLVLRAGVRVALPGAGAQRDPRLDLRNGRPRPVVPQHDRVDAGGFDAACARAPACAAAAPGSSWARIGTLAQSLREPPISGVVPGPEGASRR